MGVKLREIVLSRSIRANELESTIIAIDGPNIVSALLSFSWKGSNAPYMTDRTQRVISHLYGLLYRVNFFYSQGILPIFCFDGRDSDLKRIISKDLLKDFLYAEKLYREAINNRDKNTARNIALGKEFMWINVLKESKKLLSAIGIPVIESPASAESQCAHLVASKVAKFANSQDYDSLIFGCPRTIQNLSKSNRRKQRGRWIYEKIEPKIVNLKENLNFWGINRFQLVDLAIMVGNDYFPGIKKIGAKKALSLIKRHDNLEGVIRSQGANYDFSLLRPEVIEQVRKLFLLPSVIENTEKLYWNAPDTSRIVNFLCNEHHLNKERVKKGLFALSKNYLKCSNNFMLDLDKPLIIQKSINDAY